MVYFPLCKRLCLSITLVSHSWWRWNRNPMNKYWIIFRQSYRRYDVHLWQSLQIRHRNGDNHVRLVVLSPTLPPVSRIEEKTNLESDHESRNGQHQHQLCTWLRFIPHIIKRQEQAVFQRHFQSKLNFRNSCDFRALLTFIDYSWIVVPDNLKLHSLLILKTF